MDEGVSCEGPVEVGLDGKKLGEILAFTFSARLETACCFGFIYVRILIVIPMDNTVDSSVRERFTLLFKMVWWISSLDTINTNYTRRALLETPVQLTLCYLPHS